jgi:hypothetical protein
VPIDQRSATLDNDGTLWAEQPIYFQVVFALDRLKVLAAQHPEMRTEQPFKAALSEDLPALAALGTKQLLEIIAATHAGMSIDRFTCAPTASRPSSYQAAASNSRGRGLARRTAFHLSRCWVVGGLQFRMRPDGTPELVKLAKVEFADDGPGKPVGINRFIGRRPIFAFGNSDGDQQMLEWTAADSGASFMGLVHHTDAVREWAYDRKSHVGRLDKALHEATRRGCTVVDMKNDWKVIFPFEKDSVGSRALQ